MLPKLGMMTWSVKYICFLQCGQKNYNAIKKSIFQGKHGVFTLSLINNNGTFEISPTVAERNAYFVIRVRDNSMLDYEERLVVSFKVCLIAPTGFN